jgi:hypothetical protein
LPAQSTTQSLQFPQLALQPCRYSPSFGWQTLKAAPFVAETAEGAHEPPGHSELSLHKHSALKPVGGSARHAPRPFQIFPASDVAYCCMQQGVAPPHVAVRAKSLAQLSAHASTPSTVTQIWSAPQHVPLQSPVAQLPLSIK